MSDEFGLCPYCDNPVQIDEALSLDDYEQRTVENFMKLAYAREALIAITNLRESEEAKILAELALEEVGYEAS